MSIVKRLGRFYWCKYRDNFLSVKIFRGLSIKSNGMCLYCVALHGGKVGADAVDVEIDDGGLAGGGEKKVVVGACVHEKVFD